MGLLDRLLPRGARDSAVSVAILMKSRAPFALDAVLERLERRGIKAVRGDDAPRQSLAIVVADQPMMIVPEFPAVFDEQLTELAESAWWWPDALSTCRGHSHVVALGVPEGRGDRIERRRLASEVAVAIAEANDAVAILWRDAEALHHVRAFADLVAEKPAPIALWVSVRTAQQGATRFFFTTGLESFGHRELEMDVPPRESIDDVSLIVDLASFAIEHRTRLVPGGPAGRSPTERVTIAVEASRIPGRRDVIRLTRGEPPAPR